MKEFYLDSHRKAKNANITPITTIANEPTVPPTVTAKEFDEDGLIVSEDCRKTNENKIKKYLKQVSKLLVSKENVHDKKFCLKSEAFRKTLG